MRSRGAKTALDMGRSLGVLLAVILPAVFLWAWMAPDASVAPAPVYPAASVSLAEQAHPFAVIPPAAVPDGWIPTSAAFTGPETASVGPSTLRVGYLTPDEEYVGYQQTNRSRSDVLREELGRDPDTEGGTPTQIDGSSWESWSSDRGETILVQMHSDSVVVIDGSGSDAQKAALIRSIEAAGQ